MILSLMLSVGSPTHQRSVMTASVVDDELELAHREAFLRIGFGQQADGVDPQEVLRVCLSHGQLRRELDAKHDEEVERVAQLRQSIVRTVSCTHVEDEGRRSIQWTRFTVPRQR